ncbi:hypothetical protein [Flavobacterium sp.]|uniref:hypothetical protein n=1 Tax=Flavobacterium sp. TaxID=239 RepID=UPI00391D1E03
MKFISKDTLQSLRIDEENKFKLMEGDSIKMLYSKFGHIKHQYLNSGESGIDYYLILSNGTRYRKLKSGNNDNPSNKVKFLGKFKAENQIVMGMNCECYQYHFKTPKTKLLTETFCFSKTSPIIDYRLFGLESNLADRDFFETAERPFLKHTIESPNHIIDYTAYKIEVKNIPTEEFK